jgi:hypothetical protein
MTEKTYTNGIETYFEPGIQFLAFENCDIKKHYRDDSATIKKIYIVPYDYSDSKHVYVYLLDADSLDVLEKYSMSTIMENMRDDINDVKERCGGIYYLDDCDVDDYDMELLIEEVFDNFLYDYETIVERGKDGTIKRFSNVRMIAEFADYNNTYNIPGNKTLTITKSNVSDTLFTVQDGYNGKIVATFESPEFSMLNAYGVGYTTISVLNEKDIIVFHGNEFTYFVIIIKLPGETVKTV